MTRLGKSWIDDVEDVINSIIPKYSNIDLGSAQNPFRNLYLSGNTVSSGDEELVGNFTLTGDLIQTGDQDVTGDSAVSGSQTADEFLLTDGSALNYSKTVYATGTAYQLTNTSAALNFGTTDPVLTLDKAGTYLIYGWVNLLYNAATFAASRAVTLKVRRTNNTAADVANSSLAAATDIITTLTYTFGIFALNPVVYTTAATDDALTIFGDVAVVPSAGSLDAVGASLVAVRIGE